ncbi:MAG TPA: SIS domain-containing protein [Glaciihabitans sp.]|jgi:DNA-binding MurR/RpiR family transcriptional regulator|nr:SIS domain-containing protein [Glaciihabitans sp.]
MNTADDSTLNTSLNSPEERYAARLEKHSSASVLRARVVASEKRNLADTFEHLGEDDALVRAPAKIVAARRRYVLGAGKSFGYAALFAWDLSEGLAQVLLIDETAVRSIEVLSDVRPTDILIVFSFRRYQRRSVVVAQQFAEAGGTVVVITDSPTSPAAAFATEVVTVPTASASHADSPTAVAAVIHLLSTLSIARAKGARRRFAEREQLGKILNTYVE